MSQHSLFSPSKAAMWMNCPGSMAFPENTAPEAKSSPYADDGSATHFFASEELLGRKGLQETEINGRKYLLDQDRAERVRDYVSDVRRRANGGHLFVERFVSLSGILGPDQGGTADAIIAHPQKRLAIIEDLKDGSGEKVYASYQTPEGPQPNPQLALYALGALPDLELFGEIDDVLLVVFQPKLGHIDEYRISVGDLSAFGEKARTAGELAGAAMAAGSASFTTMGHLKAGEKQCRWCRAKAKCPELARTVADEVRLEFDDETGTAVVPVADFKELAKHYASIPLIEQWCAAIKAELTTQVSSGAQVVGPDGKPYKLVEGKLGDRKWSDEKAAEAALAGQLGPKAYTEPKLLTAPAAAKLLDKAKTKAMWKDVFEPLISRAPGKPILALGSDSRPAFAGIASSQDFEDELSQ